MKPVRSILSALALFSISFGIMACDSHRWEDTKVLNEGMNKKHSKDAQHDDHAQEGEKEASKH